MSIFSWFGQGKATAEPAASTENHTSQPAVTPEGTAHGFEWEMPTDARQHDALLWPDASIAMETGPLAVVSRGKGWNMNAGSDGTTKHFLRSRGLKAAEASGVRFVERRGLFAGREGRGAEMDASDGPGRDDPGLEL